MLLQTSAEREEKSGLGNSRYDLQLLIGELQELVKKGDTRVELKRVAALEWAYLDLLDGHPATPVTLHEWFARTPSFSSGSAAHL